MAEADLRAAVAAGALVAREGHRPLLQAIVERMRDAGATALFLEVGADNPAAQTLYEQQGFRAVGRRVDYYRRGNGRVADAVVMRLVLRRGG